MLLARILCLVLAITFIAMCIWAVGAGDFASEFGQVFAFPWGKVTIADLYMGFVLFAILYALAEPLKRAIPLMVLQLLLGNVISVLWLAWRLPELGHALRSMRSS